MNALPAELFAACFTAWVADLRERAPAIVAIDGKTSRRDRARGGDLQHPVSAWVSRQRLVLGQQAVDGKSNEIYAIPLLLERLELTGALVTSDAMGCQTEIARAIRAKGADDLLALKDNRPTLAGEVRLFFDRKPASAFDAHETTDGDHDRIELRRAFVSHDVDWLASDRRFPGAPRVPGLAMIGMVEAEVERAGRTTRARRYHLCPAPLTTRAFAAAVRAHRGVENRLHWVMDVVFHDDLMRLRSGHGPADMATVRHLALNILEGIIVRASLKLRSKTLAWDDDYRLAAFTGSPD
jgi:predicted transposase YbfD/YdcC